MLCPEPEDQLTAEQVAERLGKSVKSVRRWMRDGVTAGGRTVRLASVKVGHARVTSRGWLAAFVASQNPDPGDGAESPIRSPAEQKRAAGAARRRLAKLIGR